MSSCSTTRYSGVRQSFVNFTTYYNLFFNIKQKYKIGYNQVTRTNSENMDNVLSPFVYDDLPDVYKAVTVFNETGPKTSKLYNKKPISKWVDDALLIEGKIKYNKGDFDSAITVFDFITANYKKGFHYNDLESGKLKYLDKLVKEGTRKKTPIKEVFWRHKIAKNAALIWLVRSYTKKKKYDNAFSIYSYAISDISFPIQYRREMEKARVNLLVAQKDYEKASIVLIELIESSKSKKEKGRLYFIKAQIEELNGDEKAAAASYSDALSYPLTDDIEFEAKIKAASLANENNAMESIVMLKQMLNKGRFQSKSDKIHYVLGTNYVSLKNNEQATYQFKQAIAETKSNSQKFLAYQGIGDMYYDQRLYLPSAQYYDSAATLIPSNYPKKYEFTTRNSALSSLLKYYKEFQENDSIMTLALMGKDNAIKKIEKQLIKQQKEHDEELLTQSTKEIKPDDNSESNESWYFFNKSMVEKGKIAFQKKWGAIRLQDNWKKANINEISPINNDAKPSNNEMSEGLTPYLMAELQSSSLPFEASKQGPYLAKIKSALYGMARVYQYELKDYPKAIEMYEDLLHRYSNLTEEDEILYALYLAYRDNNQPIKAEETKNALMTKFPNSKYSKYILNPNLKSDEEKLKSIAKSRYTEAFKLYQLGNYYNSIDIIDAFVSNNETSDLLPKFKLLKAFCLSALSQFVDYKALLDIISTQYKNTEEGNKALEMLEILKNPIEKSKSKENENIKTLEATFDRKGKNNKNEVSVSNAPLDTKETNPIGEESTKTIETKQNTATSQNNSTGTKEEIVVNYYYQYDAPHYCLIQLAPNQSQALAKRTIEKYLQSNFNSMRYQVDILTISGQKFISIGKITPIEKSYTLLDLIRNESTLKDLTYGASLYIITSSNLDVLYMTDTWNAYESFYRKNYKQ